MMDERQRVIAGPQGVIAGLQLVMADLSAMSRESDDE